MLVWALAGAYPATMRLFIGLLILFFSASSPGCKFKGEADSAEGRPSVRDASQGSSDALPDYFFHATDVRVHPASRYVKEGEGLMLEARIELLDQFNEPIKDVGVMEVELRVLGPGGRIVRDDEGRQRGFRWQFDLSTPANQQQYWDPIARAYVLPLKITEQGDADLPDYRTVLRVTFDPVWPGLATLPTGDQAQQPVEVRTDW